MKSTSDKTRRALLNKTLLCIGLISSMGAIGAAQEDLILRTDRLIDGRGMVLENRDIAVLDGAIAAIFDRDPDTFVDYDLTGLTVLPGLIDTHVHLGWHFDPDGKLPAHMATTSRS